MALRAFGCRVLVMPDPKGDSGPELLPNGLLVVRDTPSNILTGTVVDVGDGEPWKVPPTHSTGMKIGAKVWYRGPNPMFGPAEIKLDKDNALIVLAPDEILCYVDPAIARPQETMDSEANEENND